jgi:hypothetical protein
LPDRSEVGDQIKFQPKEANRLREFLKWAKAGGRINGEVVETTRRVLDQFESLVKQDLDNLDATLEKLKAEKRLEVFALTADMLEKSVALSTELDLKPFDNSILAAILVRAEQLKQNGERDLAFCELDGDLQPWDKNGNIKPVLARFYDEAQLWVFGDFTMTTPERPENR